MRAEHQHVNCLPQAARKAQRGREFSKRRNRPTRGGRRAAPREAEGRRGSPAAGRAGTAGGERRGPKAHSTAPGPAALPSARQTAAPHTHTHPSPPPAAHLLVPALTGLPSPRSALTALREGRPRRRAPCGSSKQEEPQRSVPRGPAAGLQLPAGSGAVRSDCVGEKRFCTARAVRRLPAPRGLSGGTSATAAPLTDVSVLS